MPWCPKCKSEYRKGFTVCADCGSKLVEEEPVEEESSPSLEEAKFQNLSEEPADSETLEQAQKEAEQPGEETRGEDSSYVPYQDSSERASENRSSGWILLVIGTMGIIMVILGITEVLPVKLGNPYLFYGVMGAIFILFLVSGVMSIKNAKFFDRKAESENSLRSTLMDWCRENLTSEAVDKAVKAEGDSEEILYFKRFSFIKERLNHQFVNLDQGFLDQFIDDFVYEEVFDKKG